MLGPLLSPLPAWGVPEVLPPTLPAITGRHQPYTHVFPTVSPALMLCGRGGDQQGLRAASSGLSTRPSWSPLCTGCPGEHLGSFSGWRNVLLPRGEVGATKKHAWATGRWVRPGTAHRGPGLCVEAAAHPLCGRELRCVLCRHCPDQGQVQPGLLTSGSPGNAGTPLGLHLLVSRGGGGEVTCSKSLLQCPAHGDFCTNAC